MHNSAGSALELNLTPHDLLTEQDMIELTGVDRPDLQARVLAANQIFFIVNANRVPKTTWFHVNNPVHLRTPTLSLSDFGYGFTKSFHLKTENGEPAKYSQALEAKLKNFFRSAYKKAEDLVPEHIKEQIRQNEERHAQMQKTAEQLRKDREQE